MATREEQQQQIADFLKAGGAVSEIPRGQSGYVEGQSRSAWGAPRKRAPAAATEAAAAPKKAAKKVVKKR